ncbi:unnamed protein product [Toxocara canis]|uniref:FLYWCH-type domain-containing protein n=1 Tax=Toxocara canis TaxID=6265 RepID=A0A183VHJ7_TOXCA|nr:unnamed protein product [Toxocara canis]
MSRAHSLTLSHPLKNPQRQLLTLINPPKISIDGKVFRVDAKNVQQISWHRIQWRRRCSSCNKEKEKPRRAHHIKRYHRRQAVEVACGRPQIHFFNTNIDKAEQRLNFTNTNKQTPFSSQQQQKATP